MESHVPIEAYACLGFPLLSEGQLGEIDRLLGTCKTARRPDVHISRDVLCFCLKHEQFDVLDYLCRTPQHLPWRGPRSSQQWPRVESHSEVVAGEVCHFNVGPPLSLSWNTHFSEIFHSVPKQIFRDEGFSSSTILGYPVSCDITVHTLDSMSDHAIPTIVVSFVSPGPISHLIRGAVIKRFLQYYSRRPVVEVLRELQAEMSCVESYHVHLQRVLDSAHEILTNAYQDILGAQHESEEIMFLLNREDVDFGALQSRDMTLHEAVAACRQNLRRQMDCTLLL